MPEAWSDEVEALLVGALRDGAPDDPFRPAVLRWAEWTGRRPDHDALLGTLERAGTGGRGVRRFPWRMPVGRWIAPERLHRWRPAESELAERQPSDHAARLWLPPILIEHLAWLEELAAGDDALLARRARTIADRSLPVVEDVVADTVPGRDAWADTFLLWMFSRSPRALAPVRGLVLALAARYAARAARTHGVVHGRTFPFFDQPLPSATAHLATASAQLGEGMQWLDQQLAFLRAERRPDGGWGDPRQGSDVLTTIATAQLLGSIDPSFEPLSAVDPLRALASAAGPQPTLIGPEWPWVATELVRFTAWAELPFTERFRWPNVPPSAIEPRFNVPRLEGYLAVADLFRAVPALGRGRADVAFIDLAGFGSWNSDHGQSAGDELLCLLTAQLRTVPLSRTYRDGGDEFLVVGVPGTVELETNLRALCAGWPAVSRAAFPDLPVVPLRVVINDEPADELRAARERQGVAIGVLKDDHPKPPEEGIIRRWSP